eukprot:8233848-Lingulodinium_polyedra.AAC.1
MGNCQRVLVVHLSVLDPAHQDPFNATGVFSYGQTRRRAVSVCTPGHELHLQSGLGICILGQIET